MIRNSLLLLALACTSLAAAKKEPADPTPPRSYHAISDDISDCIRQEATAKTSAQRINAIQELAAVYRELKRDPRLADSPTLQKYKIRVWGRLTKIKKDLEREMEYAERSAKRRGSDDADNLQVAVSNHAGEQLAEQLMLANYSSGGPGQLFAQTATGFGGGPIRDYGADLVELIERTIAPDFWDTNGGPGSIFYYSPLRVLVVRATSEVHFKIGGGLGGLRAAGP